MDEHIECMIMHVWMLGNAWLVYNLAEKFHRGRQNIGGLGT